MDLRRLALAVWLVALIALPAPAQNEPALKDLFRGRFRVGASITSSSFGGDALLERHFNTITSENVMKWKNIHPEPEVYDFDKADRFVDYGRRHGMFVVGHVLVWHQGVPDWVLQEPIDRNMLLRRLHGHIHTVVGRYRGRIDAWDVVNEALDPWGNLLDTPWRRIIGDDYLQKAYEFAHEADPSARLYYNEYGLENPWKRAGALRLLAQLPLVTGVGMQGHYKMDWPAGQDIEAAIRELAQTGREVMISELDVDSLPPQGNPYPGGLPEELQRKLTQRYADLFRVFRKAPLSRVTFWGVNDQQSWLNDWPIEFRTNHPLLFDREGRPKPAFWSVVESAR